MSSLPTKLCCLLVGFVAGIAGPLLAGDARSALLYSAAQVDGEGIFLPQVAAGSPAHPLPHVRLTEAPPFGRALVLTDEQVRLLVERAAPELGSLAWSGARQIRIVRRARALTEEEIKQQLTEWLQRESVGGRGQLELRWLRPWTPILIPDEPYTVKVLNLPAAGVTTHFIAQFEINTARELVGRWQVPVRAQVWREVLVARNALKSREPFSVEAVVRERRDVLTLRDPPLEMPERPEALEVAEMIPAGAPIFERSVRLRPVVRRGQVVDARLQEGPMTITLKVEVLESGAPGESVRVRNLSSRREFLGRVADEQTVLVML